VQLVLILVQRAQMLTGYELTSPGGRFEPLPGSAIVAVDQPILPG
jgi:hypothetical protein